MARYYNKTRSPISASLRDGGSAYFPPKKWVTLTKEQEGSAAVVEYVRKGILARREARKPAVEGPPPPPKAPEPPKPAASVPAVPVVEVGVPVADVHVDVSIEAEKPSEDADRTSTSDGVSEESVASEGSADTESRTTRRSKSRKSRS